MALFRWGYAQWKAITAPYGSGDKYIHMTPVYEAMVKAFSPHVYEYARLRYLAAPGDNNAIRMGERLLAHTPHDLDVAEHLIDDYESQIALTGWKQKRLDKHARSRALALAEQAVRADPKNAGYRTLLASVYVTCWGTKLSPQDRNPALRGYEDYLRLAPPDDVFRPQAENIIKTLQTPGYGW